jgi:hypothetical protein
MAYRRLAGNFSNDKEVDVSGNPVMVPTCAPRSYPVSVFMDTCQPVSHLQPLPSLSHPITSSFPPYLMEQSQFEFAGQVGVSERSEYQQAIDLCVVFPLYHEPAYLAASAAGTRLRILCKLVKGSSRTTYTLDNFASTNADVINHMEKEMSALRYTMSQTQDLFHAVTVICDRFLVNTSQLAEDMTLTTNNFCDHASKENMAA